MEISIKLSQFAKDTLNGLTSSEKFLLPRYFYNKEGSIIFQQIMRMPEYYLTRCEYEIFDQQAGKIASALSENLTHLDLIELGPGDGVKSKLLLGEFVDQPIDLHYVPVDISRHALKVLRENLEASLPGHSIHEHAGDFFGLLNGNTLLTDRPKAILFLGSNIGNFNPKEREYFLHLLSKNTHPTDKLLIGFDLKKSPDVLMKAYSDPHGLTRSFNMNHLLRINKELDANFDIGNFEHHATYDPLSGAMKSYLVSNAEHSVYIEQADQTIHFNKWEPIFMELSQKFNKNDIAQLASDAGFKVVENYIDSRGYFADSLWEKK